MFKLKTIALAAIIGFGAWAVAATIGLGILANASIVGPAAPTASGIAAPPIGTIDLTAKARNLPI